MTKNPKFVCFCCGAPGELQAFVVLINFDVVAHNPKTRIFCGAPGELYAFVVLIHFMPGTGLFFNPGRDQPNTPMHSDTEGGWCSM